MAIKFSNTCDNLTGVTTYTTGGDTVATGGVWVCTDDNGGGWNVTGWKVDQSFSIAQYDRIYMRVWCGGTAGNNYGIFGPTSTNGLAIDGTELCVYYLAAAGNIIMESAGVTKGTITTGWSKGTQMDFRYVIESSSDVEVSYKTTGTSIGDDSAYTIGDGTDSINYDLIGATWYMQGNFDCVDSVNGTTFNCAEFYITDSDGIPKKKGNIGQKLISMGVM
jgi:hypothetical protein